jgi:hypothetical protein
LRFARMFIFAPHLRLAFLREPAIVTLDCLLTASAAAGA